MAVRKVFRMGNPVLRLRAEEVTPGEMGEPEFHRLVADLIETLRDARAAAISAPQVGVSKRVVVVEVTDRVRHTGFPEIPLTVLVNPRIQPLGPERMHHYEGCLSTPGLRARVPRQRQIRVDGLERTGEPVSFESEGVFAALLQHAIDHIEGRLYVDLVEDPATLTYRREWERYHYKGPWD